MIDAAQVARAVRSHAGPVVGGRVIEVTGLIVQRKYRGPRRTALRSLRLAPHICWASESISAFITPPSTLHANSRASPHSCQSLAASRASSPTPRSPR